MKKFLLLCILLTACQFEQAGHPSDATKGEIRMAEMMGISVEELRGQTHEEHMEAMQELMHKDQPGVVDSVEGFLPGEGIDGHAIPKAEPPEVLEVQDGDRIELHPTIVRKLVNGKTFLMYGYNGQIPGPIIKAPQNATITVDVVNKIDMETTIHWHGLRLDNKNDGVPDVTQKVIEPYENHTYTVTFPDEGVYWYHPHVREDIQQDMGLYGNLLITPENTDAYAPVNQEEVIVLDDIMLDEEGYPVPYGDDDATHPLMGRFGNTMLINGLTDYALDVTKGSIVRFYITNVANTRTYRVHFSGAKMKRVGSDVGRYEREEWVDAVTIAPAERYIVEVLFEEAGSFDLVHESPNAKKTLGTVTVSEGVLDESYADLFAELHDYADVQREIDAFREHFDKPVDKTLELSIELAGGMDHSMMHHGNDGIEWEDSMPQMNESMTGEEVHWKMIDTETGKENMDIHWNFSVGDVKKIRITNLADSAHPMHHPIHFHGQRFLVLSMDGKPNENLVWKDTVLIPTGSSVDLLFDMSNPGKWMFHCHIAEHLTNGMMGMFSVGE